MIIYNDKSILDCAVARYVNYILLVVLLGSSFGINADLPFIWCFISLPVCISLSALLTHIAVKNTVFYVWDKNEANKRIFFKDAYWIVSLFFSGCVALSLIVGIKMFNTVQSGFRALLFLPTILFIINLLNIPTLHYWLFEDSLTRKVKRFN